VTAWRTSVPPSPPRGTRHRGHRQVFRLGNAPGPGGQPPFLNAAVAAETTLDPLSLLRELKAIEYDLGRRPGPRWGPAPSTSTSSSAAMTASITPQLTVPHSRIAGRAFVLAPLSDITRGPLPVLGVSALDLLVPTGLQGAVRRSAL